MDCCRYILKNMDHSMLDGVYTSYVGLIAFYLTLCFGANIVCDSA